MPCAQRVTAHRLGRYRRQHELGNGPLTAREFRDQFVGAFRVGRLTILKKGDTLSLPPSRARRGFLESVHISAHVIYSVLTQETLNPFVECTSGLISGEGFSITFKLGRK